MDEYLFCSIGCAGGGGGAYVGGHLLEIVIRVRTMSGVLGCWGAGRLMLGVVVVVVVLDGLHWVDIGDARVDEHAGVGILDELGTTVGLLMMMVSGKKHLHVLCFAGR